MTVSEYRARLKANNLCRDCLRKDAYTISGRTYCYDCAEKMATAKREARKDPAKRKKMNEQSLMMRARREAQGLCKLCGAKLDEGYKLKLCRCCRAKSRKACKKSREKNGKPNERGQNGICWQCNKRPVMEGKKVCDECYAVKIANLAKAGKPSASHPWRSSYETNKKQKQG